jgi:hypothetical protein
MNVLLWLEGVDSVCSPTWSEARLSIAVVTVLMHAASEYEEV